MEVIINLIMIQNWIFHTPGGKRFCCWRKLISKSHCRPLFFFIFPFSFVPRIMMQEKQNPWKGIQKKSISFCTIEVAQPVNQHPGSNGCLHSGRFCWTLPDKILKCRCQVKWVIFWVDAASQKSPASIKAACTCEKRKSVLSMCFPYVKLLLDRNPRQEHHKEFRKTLNMMCLTMLLLSCFSL